MEEPKPAFSLFFISISLLFLSAVLTFLSYQRYNAIEPVIPEGSLIGDISVAGLSPEAAAERVSSVYGLPVELKYEDNIIHLDVPNSVNYDMLRQELESRIDEISRQNSFISYLFGEYSQPPILMDIPFNSVADAIRGYLVDEIIPRYDIAAIPDQPDGLKFRTGHSGRKLDVEASLPLIESAVRSGTVRQAELRVSSIQKPPSDLTNLEIMTKIAIDTWQDSGQVTEVYLSDPYSGHSFDIARRDHEDLPPEISFTAASTMKLPIMISSYIRMDQEPTTIAMRTLRLMITESKNDQTDWMMENIIGGPLAPFAVTEDLEKLGLKNSFLAGYFYLGAPLLDLVKTPANSRTDINLHPDVYNQTTPADMGILMNALYNCAENGSGLLTETFPEQITQAECSEMIGLLKDNHLPYLISAGVPDNVQVAHKHGWIEEDDGLLHTMGNIAAVYTDGGDYILSIYTYHPENLIFEEGSTLFAQISSAAYGFFNPEPSPDQQTKGANL